MLLTKRLERFGYAPLGFVASDYCIATWSLRVPETREQVEELFDQDMLGDDLEAWMDESTMLKRTFRRVRVIGGLIDQNVMGPKKNRRQVTFNNDIIYDVLRRHEPDHVLLRATRQDAAGGLTDVSRLGGHAGTVPRTDRSRASAPRVAHGGSSHARHRARRGGVGQFCTGRNPRSAALRH